MAVHRAANNYRPPIPKLTEPDYRELQRIWFDRDDYDAGKTSGIYTDVGEYLRGENAATINGIITPESRYTIGMEGYSGENTGKPTRPLGTVPAQNMNKTVKTGTLRLGDRTALMDGEDYEACMMSLAQQHPKFMNITHQLLNMYPAGAPLTAAEIRALEKGMLRPTKKLVSDDSDNITAVIYSDGMLCTGYIQMLDDAIQIFKSYYSTLLGKWIKVKFMSKTWEVYPKRIVYDPSRTVRCSNPVINEAAQIALECDVIYNGVKSTGLLHLTSTTTTSADFNFGNIDALTTEDFIFGAIYNRLVDVCVAQQLNTPKRCSRFITLLYILGLFQIKPSNKPIPN